MTASHTSQCGLIAMAGRPNTGKSTLMNALTGSKISIVSRRAQTTRHRIQGVLTQGPVQYVFVDTPGFQTQHAGNLNRKMNRVVRQTLADVDVVLHVVEAGRWTADDEKVLSLLPRSRPVILVPNKIDRMRDKSRLLPYVSERTQAYDYAAVVPVSAQRGTQLTHLLEEIQQHLPQAAHLFDEDALTDRPVRFLAAELIREKIFRLVGDELPYSCDVYIEQWNETDRAVDIAACVLVERESHRPILLGAGGLHMKRIATEARHDIMRLLDKHVSLDVYIKVRKGWTQQESLLRELGYD